MQLLCSLSNNMIGRQCLLRGQDNEANSAKEHFALKQASIEDNIEYVGTSVNVTERKALKVIKNDMPAHLVYCVCCVLQDALNIEFSSFAFSGAAMHAMEVMSFLSIEKQGIEACLQNK